MKPQQQFLKQDNVFWANVRYISEKVGYTAKGTGLVKVPTLAEIKAALLDADLATERIIVPDGSDLTPVGAALMDYLAYRGNVLNTYAEPHLMDVD